MIKVVYLYNVVPGKAEEARTWARKRWIPFWEKQPTVTQYQVYANYFGAKGGVSVGSPQRMVTFDIEDISSLESIFSASEFSALSAELQQFAIDVKFFIFRRSYPDG